MSSTTDCLYGMERRLTSSQQIARSENETVAEIDIPRDEWSEETVTQRLLSVRGAMLIAG
jgi:hypothetical protein